MHLVALKVDSDFWGNHVIVICLQPSGVSDKIGKIHSVKIDAEIDILEWLYF